MLIINKRPTGPSLIKKSVLKSIFHQNKFRINTQNLEQLEKELNPLLEARLEKVMRSAKISGRRNIQEEDWKEPG
jgi:hypothetical protein